MKARQVAVVFNPLMLAYTRFYAFEVCCLGGLGLPVLICGFHALYETCVTLKGISACSSTGLVRCLSRKVGAAIRCHMGSRLGNLEAKPKNNTWG